MNPNEIIKDILEKTEDLDELQILGQKAIISIKAMSKNMKSKGYGHIVEKYFPCGVDIDSIERLENDVRVNAPKINAYSSLNDCESIFHSIQLWGGKAGRNTYLMDGGFDNNINLHAYRDLAVICSISDSLDQIVKEVVKFYELTNNIGIAFITKHTKYLSLSNDQFPALPIYDSIMSKNIMGKKYARKNELTMYWKAMIEECNLRNISLDFAERIIFNHFR